MTARFTRILFLSFAAMIVCPAYGQSDEDATTAGSEDSGTGSEAESEADSLQALISDLEAIMKERKVPGAGVAIVTRDENLWVGGLGIADLESGREADGNTLWRIGSTSKMFVSLSALKMQEAGVFGLSDSLRDHVDDIPFENPWSETDPITLEHLLEHTSGFDDLHMNEYALQEPDIGLGDALRYNPRSRKSRWRPGTYSTYSNANPPIVAYVIEKKTGLPFEEYVQEAFFDPLRMDSASYFLTDEVEERLARGYTGNGADRKTVDYWHIIMRPSGSINASAEDMSKFVSFFLNRGAVGDRRLLEEASIQRMETVTTSYAAKAGLELGYALNNYGKPNSGYRWQGHNGGMPGYLADLSYLPEHGFGYAVMINKSSRALGEMSQRITKFFTSQLPEVDAPEIEAMAQEELERFAGIYKPRAVRNQFQFAQIRLGFTIVSVVDDGLEAGGITGRKQTLKPAGGGVFYVNNNKIPSRAFFEDADGRMCFDTMVRTPAWRVWTELAVVVLSLVMVAVSLLFALVAGAAFLARKLKPGVDWTTALMPSYAVLAQVASILVLLPFLSDPFTALGTFTWPGLLSYLFSWAYPVLVAVACARTWKAFRSGAPMGRWLKIYLSFACLSGVAINAYMFYWNSWLPPWMV